MIIIIILNFFWCLTYRTLCLVPCVSGGSVDSRHSVVVNVFPGEGVCCCPAPPLPVLFPPLTTIPTPGASPNPGIGSPRVYGRRGRTGPAKGKIIAGNDEIRRGIKTAVNEFDIIWVLQSTILIPTVSVSQAFLSPLTQPGRNVFFLRSMKTGIYRWLSLSK